MRSTDSCPRTISRVEQRALLEAVFAVEDRADAGLHVAMADVGHEAEAPLVDADQRHVVPDEVARGGEHGAVAADHDGEVGSSRRSRRSRCRARRAPAAVSFSMKTSQPRFSRKASSSRSDAAISGLPSLPISATRPKLGFAAEDGIGDECTMNPMLDERAQILLKTLVERYIAEGQPVGSRTLSKYSGLDLSPATIRNVMADLEELGLIASPHTSAGRMPTPRGYRFFVDTLLVIKPLEAQQMQRMEDELHPDHPQRVVQAASQLLSQLTQFAGVVMTPRRRAMSFQHIEFLRLSEKRVLLIIVTPEGDVQNRILFTDRDYTPSELIEAANYINQHYAGLTFEDVRARLQGELSRAAPGHRHAHAPRRSMPATAPWPRAASST